MMNLMEIKESNSRGNGIEPMTNTGLNMFQDQPMIRTGSVNIFVILASLLAGF